MMQTRSLWFVALVASCSSPADPLGPDAGPGPGADAPTCVAETLAEHCTAAGYECGEASFTDCGTTITGSCGTCRTGTCNPDHSCTAVKTWQTVPWPSPGAPMNAMWNVPGTERIWGAGLGKLWTIDGGTITAHDFGVQLEAIHGTADDMWTVGGGLAWHSVNGGAFTVLANADLSPYRLFDLFSFGAADVWVTTNGINSVAHWSGSDWRFYSLPSTALYANCKGLWGAAPNDLWAACSKGDLFHWNGTTWTKVTSPTTQDLHDIYGFAANDIWAVGANNVLLHYDGVAWTRLTAPGAGPLYGVWGSSPSDVYAVGGRTLGGGRVLRFNGTSWSEVVTTSAGDLRLVSGAQGSVWAAGTPSVLIVYR